jgi:hypothetical protein
MNDSIKLLNNGGSLSETDLKLISGTPLLLDMMRNRRLIMVPSGKDVNWTALMDKMAGLYHIRRIEGDKLYQIWFEVKTDIDQFEKNLYMEKLGNTVHIEDK